jgi:hypothetical protein
MLRWTIAGSLAVLTCAAAPDASALTWKGHTWNVTSGGMAGVAKGSPSNVSIDADGYLHLKIVDTGGTWTASELFTTDKLGFGTYQWQVDGPIDRFDKNVVLGLFPYGPAAGIGGDGTNEIDIEYSFWGHADGDNGDWTDYPASVLAERHAFHFSIHLEKGQHSGFSPERRSTCRRQHGPHQDLDVLAHESDDEHPAAGVAARDQPVVLSGAALGREGRRSDHS